MSANMSGVASRNRAISNPSQKSRGRTNEMQDFAMAPSTIPKYFDPCAATGSMFLYAQGPSVVCCHHDTLTIERRFSRHSEEVQLLAVDNQSETGGGRLVVSYDAGQTAIVWDLMTGDEIARFASYEHLTVAAWMRNGNVAFGNTQGNVIQFEPTTSEHISTRTIDQIAVTALAPSGDCRTFAIGYQNGNCLVATLQPRFTILHNLSTNRGPSPIVTLSWHASSSRQKSDMLASQTQDGDLRVWSVAKSYNSNDPAKVVRILKRTEDYRNGPNWMAWSKNGRIIQFSDSETLSWDVRTKHVTHDSIPTLEHVRGIAVYGPGASLFTLGANNTVQQFDLNAPAIMVANVQHPANLFPPSPPVSIEEQADKATTIASASESEITFNPSDVGISESDEDHLSPMERMNMTRQRRYYDLSESGGEQYDATSMATSRSGVSKSSTGSKTPGQYPSSLRSRGMTENTYISAGSSLRSSKAPYKHGDMYSQSSLSTTSTASRRRPSRLRNEITQDPEETKVTDLFKFTRSRLSDIPYKHPMVADNARLTNDDLRRQMLSTIFGWNKEIDELVHDEMSRHPNGSPSRIMLAKWLGYIDQDIMTTSSESMTSSDWMLLALSGIGGQASQHKLGRAYVTRLLEKGDVHAATTIMIGMGDHNDAIEIYNSHKRYMEALILTCLFFPGVWERQEAIIKKWGEWAVQHGQQQLAIRCFACTGKESSEPWASPSAAQLTFQSIGGAIPDVLSPPLSPPGVNRGPQRSIAKTSALKLITSFNNDPSGKSKFFSQGDDGQTPIAAGVTPIAESAIDNEEPATAFVRSNRSGFNTPTTGKSFASSAFSRARLPSIGEMQGEIAPPIERRRTPGHSRKSSMEQDNLASGMALQRSATASPMMMRENHRRLTQDLPMPSPNPSVAVKMEYLGGGLRNGPRDRIPAGLQLQIESVEPEKEPDITSPEPSTTSSARFHWPRRRGPPSVGSVTSASTSRSVRSTATGGRHLDNYIHSLDAASDYRKKQRSRNPSYDRSDTQTPRGRRPASRERNDQIEPPEDRGRTPSRQYPAKRSPTSPIPMSPEELVNLSTPRNPDETGAALDPVTARKQSKSRASSRGARHRSPDKYARARSTGRDGSVIRSPSSPVPMSAVPLDGSEDEEDYYKALEDQEKFRTRHNRSTSRGIGAQPSPEFTKDQKRDRSRSRRHTPGTPEEQLQILARAGSLDNSGDLRKIKDDRQRKKEQAARELEARRRELAKPSHTGSSSKHKNTSPNLFRNHAVEMSPPTDLPPRSMTADPTRSLYGRGPTGQAHIGLPATPKAMRLVLDADLGRGSAPSVPSIPDKFQKKSPGSSPGSSPKKVDEPTLTLLPSTVYTPPAASIPRCMSAPIPDDPAKRGMRRGSTRQGSRAQKPAELRGLESSSNYVRRGSHDQQVPPPPPPPPVLKELQHLAIPPPPPPAPLPNAPRQNTSALASGMIEIVMDEEETAPAPVAVPPNDMTVPVLPPPAPPSLKGHTRGRSSITDNSIAGRFSKATERLRSASRSRKDASMRSNKSPVEVAPYESIPPPMSFNNIRPPINTQNLPTGLHESELI